MGYLSIFKGWGIISLSSFYPQWPWSVFTVRFVGEDLNRRIEASGFPLK